MKISDATFDYLFKTAIKDKYDTFRKILTGRGHEFDGEFVLTAPVYKELMSVAAEFDPDYEPLFEQGETADIFVMFPENIMYTRMAGYPGPYAEEEYEEDEEPGFDAIGEWTITIPTKEVEFEVDVTT